jgi:FKBP-type peptidyl-prolyl cis-trans isomerase FkpA
MTKKIIFLLTIALLIWNCKGSSGKSALGYQYTKHTSGSGAKLKIGEYAYCNLYIKDKEKILFSTEKVGQVARIQYADPKSSDISLQPILEALSMMGKGDSLTIIQNIDTLKNKPQGLEKTKEITYTIKLVDIKGQKDYDADMAVDMQKQEVKALGVKKVMESFSASMPIFKAREKTVADSVAMIVKEYKAGKFNGQIKTTANGLKYMILKQGNGVSAKSGSSAFVQYYGALAADGKHFDDSYSRGMPFNFVIDSGSVIPGWEEGFKLLNEGTTAVFFIPSKLGYGESGNGPIPANSELIFYVDLLKVL